MEPTTMEEQKRGNKTWYIIVLIILLAIFAFLLLGNDKDAEPLNRPEEEQLVGGDDSNAIVASNYKNGVYSANGEYLSPGGAESVGVMLTIQNDIITDATVLSHAERPISVTMQADFIANYKTFVIGKNIDEVSLDKVSGSSLTPKGFNDAVAKIKIEARS